MEFFDALNLEAIPREQNKMANHIAVVASSLQPSQELLDGDGKLEINFRPSVPNNMEHWQVFRDDEQILRFIHNVQEFSNFNISFQEEGEGNQFSNPILRGLVPLENRFDRHDRKKNIVDQMKLGDYIEVNIGTDQNSKLIKIGKATSQKERNELINLVKEYREIIAFTYDEL